MTDQFSGFKRTMWQKGEASPHFKGEAACVFAKRVRAHKYPLREKCDNCDAAAVDRHHVDGDVGNNAESNIAHLCRRCHMTADGRLDRFVRFRRKPLPQRPCIDCTKPSKPLWKGRCHTCDMKARRAAKKLQDCHRKKHNQ